MQGRTRFAPAVAAIPLLVAAALAMPRAHAAPCGAQDDFLARSEPLMSLVRPADCATILGGAPDFAWPLQKQGATYTLALTFPDGHTETRSTTRNWLAWDRALPAGNYTWRVRLSGRQARSSEPRTFRVDAAPASRSSPRGNDGTRSMFRVEAAPTWVPAPAALPEARRKAPTGGLFGAFTQ